MIYTVSAGSCMGMVSDQGPDYSETDSELMDFYGYRLEEVVDEERYIPDEYSAAFLAMKLGLCLIEYSEEDAVSLRNRIWMENGKEEKLKEYLISEIDNEDLEKLTAESLWEIYNESRSD